MWAGMGWLLSGLLDSFHLKNTVHLYPQHLPVPFPSPTECHIGDTGLNHTETTLKSSGEQMSKCSITRYSWTSVIYYTDSVHIPGKALRKKLPLVHARHRFIVQGRAALLMDCFSPSHCCFFQCNMSYLAGTMTLTPVKDKVSQESLRRVWCCWYSD